MTIFLSKVWFQVDKPSLDKLGSELEKKIQWKSEVKIKAQLDLAKAEAQLAKFNNEMKKISAVWNPAEWEKMRVKVLDATDQVNKYKKSLDDVNRATDQVWQKVPMWQKLGAAIGWALAIGTVVNWWKQIFNAASQVQQLQISFGTMLNSAEKGKKLFADLQQFAKVTPFNATEIQKSTQLLLAFWYDANKIIPTMKAIGEAVSAAGGGGEQLLNISRAIGQIQTKGKLSAEEVNQLAENGIGAWKLLSEAMGKSQAELMKMAADGKLLANDVLPALTAQMEKTFWGNMEKQAKTLNGRLSNIQDTFTQTLASIGTTVNPVFNTILDILAKIVNAIWFATKEFPVLTGVIITLIGAVWLLGGAMVILGPIIAWLGTALAWLGIASLLNPIWLVITAVAALWLGIAATTDIMREADPVINDINDSLAALEEQQRKNEQAYRDGTITAEEYRKKTEENSIAMQDAQTQWEEYKKWLDIINDRHLNYIEKIKQINALKLNPSAYDTLIAKNKETQNELIKSINLQRILLKEKLAMADKEVDDVKWSFPIINWQWWLTTNQWPSKFQLWLLDEVINKRNDLAESMMKEDDILRKQIEDVMKLSAEWEGLIKVNEKIGDTINGGAWASSGAKKENEKLKKSVDDVKDSYKILENNLKKLETTRKKQIDAERKWNESLRVEQEKTEKSIVKVREEYEKTIDKLNEDSSKQSTDTAWGYYRSLLEDQKKLNEEIMWGNGDSSTIKTLETVQAQIKELQSSGFLDQNTRAREDQRIGLSDQEQERFDFMEKYAQIQIDLANKTSEATDKFAESRQQLQDMQDVISFFRGTNERGVKLQNTANGLKDKFDNDETSNLIDRLLKEKQNLIEVTDARISAENQVHREAQKLAEEYHIAELGMVQARKAEYDDLITKIRAAIQAAQALRAEQEAARLSGGWFAEWGYTGDGGIYDVAGTVHKWEYVIPQTVLSKLQSSMPSVIPTLENMRLGGGSSSQSVDNSKHMSITWPITVQKAIDFDALLSKALWRMGR